MPGTLQTARGLNKSRNQNHRDKSMPTPPRRHGCEVEMAISSSKGQAIRLSLLTVTAFGCCCTCARAGELHCTLYRITYALFGHC